MSGQSTNQTERSGWNSTRVWAALALSTGASAAVVYNTAKTQGLPAGLEGTVVGSLGLLLLVLCILCTLKVALRGTTRVTSS